MKINRAKLHRVYRYILDWFFPNRCPCCRTFIDYDKDFCEKCAESMTVYDGAAEIPNVDGFTAYCVYDINIKNAILRFKHTDRGNCYFAFAYRIKSALEKCGMNGDIDFIVPIPMSKTSRKERGYNQAELMAKELRYMIGVPYANVLMKVRETAQQKTLGREGRANNLRDAFAVDPKFGDISGKCFLLIDDVCTTGSTFAEAAKVLKANGAAKVFAASFAKTPNKHKDEPDDEIPDIDDLEPEEQSFVQQIMGGQ